DEDPSDEDEGTGMGDSTGVSVSLGEISLEGNKSWESNISESDNTGDGGKIAGRAITTWGGGMFRMFVEEKAFSISESDGTILE
nr:hypothetical protein [Tanacetum cinerariifolium]